MLWLCFLFIIDNITEDDNTKMEMESISKNNNLDFINIKHIPFSSSFNKSFMESELNTPEFKKNNKGSNLFSFEESYSQEKSMEKNTFKSKFAKAKIDIETKPDQINIDNMLSLKLKENYIFPGHSINNQLFSFNPMKNDTVKPIYPLNLSLNTAQATNHSKNMNSNYSIENEILIFDEPSKEIYNQIEKPTVRCKSNKPNDLCNNTENSTENLDSCLNTISRFDNDFKKIKSIGSGDFGMVYECQNKLDGVLYAVKITNECVNRSQISFALNEAVA